MQVNGLEETEQFPESSREKVKATEQKNSRKPETALVVLRNQRALNSTDYTTLLCWFKL